MALSNEEASFIRNMQAQLDYLTAQLKSVQIAGEKPASMPGQYPGKPIPHTEGVEIDIEATTNMQTGNITLAADGPFYAARIVCSFRPTAGITGHWRPICSVDDPDGVTFVDVIDFYWEYQVSGSHRNRQNIPVPSSGIWRSEEGNGAWEFATFDVFQPTSTITIKITPNYAPSHAGVLYFGFHGFYSLE